jgi:hypothetical protein
MTFIHFVRRLHLYLGLSLLPWFLAYGVSSMVFSHPGAFEQKPADGVPDWKVRFDRHYDIGVVPDGDQREVGARIMRDAGLKGAFGTYHPNPREFHAYVFSFWTATQAKYFPEQKRLVVEDRRFRWDHFLTGMHARGGFHQESVLNDAWGIVVDLVCLGMLTWVLSGLYTWWKIRAVRWWGFLAIASGVLSFATFLLVL